MCVTHTSAYKQVHTHQSNDEPGMKTMYKSCSACFTKIGQIIKCSFVLILSTYSRSQPDSTPA